MGHNIGYLHVDVQTCILAACQPLIRVRPMHVPVPLLHQLCWKESWLWAAKEICCTRTLLVLRPQSGLCSVHPLMKSMCLSCPVAHTCSGLQDLQGGAYGDVHI